MHLADSIDAAGKVHGSFASLRMTRRAQDDRALWIGMFSCHRHKARTLTWFSHAHGENLFCLHHDQPVEDALYRRDEQSYAAGAGAQTGHWLKLCREVQAR